MELYLNNQFTRTMNGLATFKDAQGNVVSKDYFKREEIGYLAILQMES
jgi:hypothetical protein